MLAQNRSVWGPGMHLQDLNLVPSLQILQDLCTASFRFWSIYNSDIYGLSSGAGMAVYAIVPFHFLSIACPYRIQFNSEFQQE